MSGAVASLLLLVAAGGVVAAASGLTSSWDGGYYIFRIVDRQAVFTPSRRQIGALLSLPVLLASRLTGDGFLLELVFGLTWVLVPLVVLGACVLVVGPRSPLLVWPALGIGFGTLVAEANAVSEARLSVQLFWPALLAVLAGRALRRSLLAIALAALSVMAHPFAIATLGATAVAAVLRRSWPWTCLLGGLTVTAAVRLARWSSRYEQNHLTTHQLEGAIRLALSGLHGLAFVAATAAAVLLVIQPRLGGVTARRRAGLFALAGLAGATTSLVAWATSAASLPQSLYLRLSLPLLVAGFGILAGLDVALRVGGHGAGAEEERQTRAAATVLAGITFALVLAIQAGHWAAYRARLHAGLARATQACVPFDALPASVGTSQPFWSVPAYSMVIQGRQVSRVAQPAAVCAAGDLAQRVLVTPWETREYGRGWFDLERLRPGPGRATQ